MVTSSGYGAISPLASTVPYRTAKERDKTLRPASGKNKFDSLILSSAHSGESRFQLDMASRLTQQVRTATTTGDICALREQVSAGQYTPDPMSIAARMLLLGEEM